MVTVAKFSTASGGAGPMTWPACRNDNIDNAVWRTLRPPRAGPVAAAHRHPVPRDRSLQGERPVDPRPAPGLPHRAERAVRHGDVPPRLLRGHRLLQLRLHLVLRGDEALPDPAPLPRALRPGVRRRRRAAP